MFAGILLYTRIYTTVIARSAATWQSSFVTFPRSRDAKHTPQPQFPFDSLDSFRITSTPPKHIDAINQIKPTCPNVRNIAFVSSVPLVLYVPPA